jgi:hypothetical protein
VVGPKENNHILFVANSISDNSLPNVTPLECTNPELELRKFSVSQLDKIIRDSTTAGWILLANSGLASQSTLHCEIQDFDMYTIVNGSLKAKSESVFDAVPMLRQIMKCVKSYSSRLCFLNFKKQSVQICMFVCTGADIAQHLCRPAIGKHAIIVCSVYHVICRYPCTYRFVHHCNFSEKCCLTLVQGTLFVDVISIQFFANLFHFNFNLFSTEYMSKRFMAYKVLYDLSGMQPFAKKLMNSILLCKFTSPYRIYSVFWVLLFFFYAFSLDFLRF